MREPIIGISIGDPAGVGCEVSLKAIMNSNVLNKSKVILIGDKDVIKKTYEIVKCDMELNEINNIDEYQNKKINYISLNNAEFDYEYGKVQAVCGKVSFQYIEKAINLALEDKIDAVVTAPINKEALHFGGHQYSGHTEIFADLTSTKDYAMLLTGGPLKVIHVTTHVSMREACDKIKKDRILTVIRLSKEAMMNLGVQQPKIAVAGFNAHSGEHGLFGNEEILEIIPAIEEARNEGIEVYGPISPDTVFMHAKNGKYDIVVVMYHDQGHIPLKLLDFMGGVNTTVGLPIIRTSVDHGTAFGKAGKGTADENSMINAIEMAISFSNNRIMQSTTSIVTLPID